MTIRGIKIHSNLNPRLIKQQGISEDDVISLNAIHIEREELFDKFEMHNLKKLLREEIDELILELENLEFIMQSVWRFDENRKKHTWWNKMPNCSCRMVGRYGKEITRIIEDGCPIHGKSELALSEG